MSPTHTDWSIEDCLRFRSLVLDKSFAASIVQIENDDPTNPMEMIVSLKLIDTSTHIDISIADLFVSEKRAVKTSL